MFDLVASYEQCQVEQQSAFKFVINSLFHWMAFMDNFEEE